jgi:hypothetical protein
MNHDWERIIARISEPLEQARKQLELLAAVPPDVLRQLQAGSDAARGVVEQMSGIGDQLSEQFRAHTDLFENLRQRYDWVEAAQRHHRVGVEARALFLKRGWLGLEYHLTQGDLEEVCSIANRDGDDAADLYVCSLFNRDGYELATVTEHWADIPYLTARQPIVSSATNAHERGDYWLTVPAILPLVDGLTWELFEKDDEFASDRADLAKSKKKKRTIHVSAVIEKLYGEGGEWAMLCTTLVNTVLYKGYNFATEVAPFPLNRHGVSHGQTADYGTQANSLRVFLLLDTVAHLAATALGSVAEERSE